MVQLSLYRGGNLTYNEFADLVKWGQSPEKLPNSFSLEMSLLKTIRLQTFIFQSCEIIAPSWTIVIFRFPKYLSKKKVRIQTSNHHILAVMTAHVKELANVWPSLKIQQLLTL